MADRIEDARRACPHCGDTFKAIPQGFANADAYDRVATVRADCCGMAVAITPVRRFRLSHSDRTEDDWGQPCKSARQKGGA
jgi:hypothetical protein